jgi:hypothetical protein
MHFNALFLLSALVPTACAFQFLRPDTSKPFNYSEPVVFEWSPDENLQVPHSSMRWLKLHFHSTGVWPISDAIDWRGNITSHVWDAPEWFEYMEDVDQQLFDGKRNFFSANFYSSPNFTFIESAMSIETDKFEIVGYPHLSAGASGHSTSLGVGVALAIAACITVGL